MNGKCDSHDECFTRLYKKIEDVLEKLDGLKDSMHDWREEVNVRFVQIEMRLARAEEQLTASESSRTDISWKVTGVLFDLGKMAAIGIGGAAAWALTHGYLGWK